MDITAVLITGSAILSITALLLTLLLDAGRPRFRCKPPKRTEPSCASIFSASVVNGEPSSHSAGRLSQPLSPRLGTLDVVLPPPYTEPDALQARR